MEDLIIDDDKLYFIPSFLALFGISKLEIENIYEKYKYDLDNIFCEIYNYGRDSRIYFTKTKVIQSLKLKWIG